MKVWVDNSLKKIRWLKAFQTDNLPKLSNGCPCSVPTKALNVLSKPGFYLSTKSLLICEPDSSQSVDQIKLKLSQKKPPMGHGILNNISMVFSLS